MVEETSASVVASVVVAAAAMMMLCPVCATPFAPENGAGFALHVADCTTPHASSALSETPRPYEVEVVNGVASGSLANVASCPRCHHVYASGTAEYVVKFHEFECERVNRLEMTSASSVVKQGKRPREAPTSSSRRGSDGAAASSSRRASSSGGSSTTTAAKDADDDVAAEGVESRKVTLFPSQCALCGSGGRSLLHCSGECARVFHAACVDDVQPGNSKTASSSVSGIGSGSRWTCAECARGVHRCQLCGFLGHESNTLQKCSLVDCGYFFHPSCLQTQSLSSSPLICPRHSCAKCSVVERDMRACQSCTKCFCMTHLRCVGAAAATADGKSAASAPLTRGGGRTPNTNLHVCAAHPGSSSSSKPSAEETIALRYRVQQGDIVLILELANAILPQTAKDVAPDACNQWGVVSRAENIDGRDQLLTISIFSDGSAISVPNRYVLPIGNANSFPTPQAMLRECVKWHAVTELNLRHAELDTAVGGPRNEKRDQILNASCSAFYARAEKLSLSITQLFTTAKEGFVFWDTHRTELKTFEGSDAPLYVYLDTRAKPKHALPAAASQRQGRLVGVNSQGSAQDEEDVDMEDTTDTTPGSGQDSTNSSSTKTHSTGSAAMLQAHQQETSDSTMETAAPFPDKANGNAEKQVAVTEGDTPDSTDEALEQVSSTAEVSSEAESTPTQSGEDSAAAVTVSTASGDQDWCVEAAGKSQDPSSAKKATEAAGASLTNDHPICGEKRGEESVTDKTDPEATFVDAIEVTVVSRDGHSRPEGDSTLPHDSKRQKVSHGGLPKLTKPSFALGPPSIAFTAALSSSNTFAREKENYEKQIPMKQPTRKQRKLADFSSEMQKELERQAMLFLSEEENPPLQRSSRRKSAHPKHSAAAFPFASSMESFRPPYYRPSIAFSRVRGRRMDGVSRILLSQDKRNIKCFIQGTEENRCLNEPTIVAEGSLSSSLTISRSKTSFVTVDLMSVKGFSALEMLVRTRMVAAVEQNDSYLREIYDVGAERARRLIAEKKKSLRMDLYYCSYDGRRYKVQSKRDDWLCFCANVCHLTAVIPLQE